MGSLFVETPASLAWAAVCSLIDRPANVLQEEWGVENFGSSSPVERELHVRGKTLKLRLENQHEITAKINERGRERQFEISISEAGQALLVEQDGKAKSVRQVLDALVSWLKEKLSSV